MALKSLRETPEEFAANTILYRLAEALGYRKRETILEGLPNGDPGWPILNIIDADPDEVLNKAIRVIRKIHVEVEEKEER